MARYVKYIEPVDYLGGKFAKENDKIRAGENGTNGTNVILRSREYQQTGRVNRSYAIMTNSTATTEPTSEVDALRQKFSLVVAAVNVALQDPEQTAALKAAFEKQTKYNTLRGFTFAQKWAMN